MIVLCALREMRPRLDACNYLGEGGDVQPIIRQVTSAPLLRDAAVQRAAQAPVSYTHLTLPTTPYV